MKYVPPSVRETAFNCPHCQALAQQFWHSLRGQKMSDGERPFIIYSSDGLEEYLENIEDIKEKEIQRKRINTITKGIPLLKIKGTYSFSIQLYNVFLSECFNCGALSVWIHNNLVYPQRGRAPPANPDLSGDIRRDYDEASSVLDLSPRGAAALLRLAVQKLCKELGESGKNLNGDIKKLVARGLDVQIQKALDVVRVTGNEAVHPGQMDLRDDDTTANALFGLVNLIAEKMISAPKHIGELYSALPEDKLKQIENRDGKSSDGIGTIETVGLRLLDLFKAEPTDENRQEMMGHWINFLYWHDFYPKEEIEDLHDLQTPTELVWATVSLANPRIDDLMAMFPDLTSHPEPQQLVKTLIPDLETFLDLA